MIERIGEDKFKYYLGRTSPLDNESYAFEIAVFKNDKNEWSAYLLYGPFDYINEEF